MWPHLLCAGIGVWLMAAPDVLRYDDPARTNDHIVGPLVATFACTAVFQSMRGMRWVSAVLGAWLLAAPLVFGYEMVPLIHSVVAGITIGLLSLIRGPITEQFGGGWPMLWRRPTQQRA